MGVQGQGLGDMDTPARGSSSSPSTPGCAHQVLHPSPAELWGSLGSPRPQLCPSRGDGFVLMAGDFFLLFFFAHVSQKNHKFQAVKSRCVSSLQNEVILNVTKVSLIHPGQFLLPSPKL